MKYRLNPCGDDTKRIVCQILERKEQNAWKQCQCPYHTSEAVCGTWCAMFALNWIDNRSQGIPILRTEKTASADTPVAYLHCCKREIILEEYKQEDL